MAARGLRLLGAVAGVLGAAAYSSFLMGPVVHSRLSPSTSFVSELEATGQPYAGLFRLSDVLSGLLIVVVAWTLYRLLPPDRTSTTGCLLIAVMGAASVADGATTMGCAPSLNAACRAGDSTVWGLLSHTFESHTLSGLAGFLGGAGGMLLIGMALRRPAASDAPGSTGGTASGMAGAGGTATGTASRTATETASRTAVRTAGETAIGTASFVLGLTLGAVGLIDLALLAVNHWFGLAERARALLISLWLLRAAAYAANRSIDRRLLESRKIHPLC